MHCMVTIHVRRGFTLELGELLYHEADSYWRKSKIDDRWTHIARRFKANVRSLVIENTSNLRQESGC